MISLKVWPLVLSIFFVSTNKIFSQNEIISVRGSANLSQEFYSVSGLESRRPSTVSRAIMRMTFSLYEQIQAEELTELMINCFMVLPLVIHLVINRI